MKRLRDDLKKEFDDLEATVADLRYKYITKHFSRCLKTTQNQNELSFSEKADKILTHSFWEYRYFCFSCI
jgi:Fe2+ transport system protein B